MTDRTLPVPAIVAAGIGLGFAADQFLRVPGAGGLNLFLLFVGLACSIWVVTQSGGSSLSREAWSWIGVGVLCSATLMWRDSDLLRFGSFVAACTAFALPALEAGRGWVRRSGTLDIVEAVAGAGLFGAFGGARLINRVHPSEVEPGTAGRTVRSVARTALGGALLALVPLVVFGALFVSADRVFATIVSDFIRVDLGTFASHLVATAILSWLACGYLVGVSSGTRLKEVRRLLPDRPSLGVAEVATALALVDLLFLGFVTVQFRYLFGGASWVEVTPGLSYAEYARSGFFQLVVAVGLAVPWLLATHALLEDRGLKARSVFSGFAGLHLFLLFAVVASAIQRMLVYQRAYGLTEDRIVAMAILIALTVVLVWFGATVFGGRRDRFAFGALVTAFVLVGALQIIDPAGLAARHHLDRVAEPGEADVEHLVSLGSDAAPVLVSRLGELPDEARCRVASRLLSRWGPERPAYWVSFNWADHRARKAVNGELAALRSMVGGVDCG